MATFDSPQETNVVVALEQLAERAMYGRLLAWLSARTGDISAAEEALAEAFSAALRNWTSHGLPATPQGWLLTTAWRRFLDQRRRSAVASRAVAHVLHLAADIATDDPNHLEFEMLTDDRLKLLFVCAHPAIDPAARVPLMLQVVIGLDAARIALAFLVPPATMGQRLVRAKAKIRDAQIPFQVPEADQLPTRLSAVLECVYAIYGFGWDAIDTADRGVSLTDEAIWLARLLVTLMPDDPETKGLLSLMLSCEARRASRRKATSDAYVPLNEQDMSLWCKDKIEEADALLRVAASAGVVGVYQLQAAIQSTHNRRLITLRTDWQKIAQLYEGLVELGGSVGAVVGYAVARANVDGPVVGLELLDQLRDRAVVFQPWWAARAELLARAGEVASAREAYHVAIKLADAQPVRDFLAARRARLLN